MTTQIQLRRDTAANWTTADPILALGEPGLETDTGRLKHGDGDTHWVSLDYITGDITFNGVDIQGSGTGQVAGSINLVPNTTIKGSGQYVEIYPTNAFDYPHVHIAAGSGGELYIGSDDQYIKTHSDGKISISAEPDSGSNKVWQFGTDGALTMPTLTVPVNDAGYNNVTGQVLKFGDSDAGQAIIFGPEATTGAAQRLAIQGATGADGTTGEGGDVYIWAGRGGSEVDAVGGGDGGDVKVRAGQGRGPSASGGYVKIQGGDSDNGVGGSVDIQGGDGTGDGGYTRILTSTGTERIKVDADGVKFNASYTFPAADGAADQVLTAHADGTLTWEDTGNPFDQDLNTTDDPTFAEVYLTTAVYTPKVDAAINGTLVLQGEELQFKTVDVSTASHFLNLNSTGYTYDLPLNTFSVALNRAATTVGTTSATFNHYILTGNVTNGSNLITNVVVTDIYGDAVIDLSTVTDIIGVPLLDYDTGYFNLGVAVSAISYSGAYDPDPGTNAQVGTLTLSVQDSAITATANCQGATGTGLAFDISHYIRNATATNVCTIGKDSTTGLYESGGLYRDASNNGSQDGAALTVTYASYSYTGTQDWQITPRRVLKLQPKNVINEHVNIPFGLGVGPGAISTDRGVERASNDTVGINIHNNGKLIGYALPTGVTLTQFKNNSYFSSGVTAERCGPTFTFNSFAGDSDTATNALYLTDQDGVGQIKFFATTASSSLASFASAPASITAKATETHNSSTKQGVGLYLQYSPNSQTAAGRPKTFLRAENATTELLAKTTLKLGKITTGTGSSTAVLSQAAQSTWLTLDDTAATFTAPVKFPVYTRTTAAAVTGSVGMQIAISDSSGSPSQSDDGMMVYWCTNGTPQWRYIHNNGAL